MEIIEKKEHDIHYIYGISYEGFHKLAYWDFGDKNNDNVIICVHGFSRSKVDFEIIALHLAKKFRVVCLDVVGRGSSDRLLDPKNYSYTQYFSDINALIQSLKAKNLYWIGSSMGGIIGLLMAGSKNNPIKKLVLNDVGTGVKAENIKNLATRVSEAHTFDTFEEALQQFKKDYEAFGELPKERWERLACQTYTQNSDGKYVKNYDIRITDPIKDQSAVKDISFKLQWELIKIPVLVIRGENSSHLDKNDYEEMIKKDKVSGIVIPNCGHIPPLISELEIAAIENFLLKQIYNCQLISQVQEFIMLQAQLN